MRRAYVLALCACACGARSEITGSDELVDASNVHDGGSDVVILPPQCKTTNVITACQQPTDCTGCKFTVDWTCGETQFTASGACGDSLYQGKCNEDGKKTFSFESSGACECTDTSTLATVVQEKCTHP